jgi:hypothetical protein
VTRAFYALEEAVPWPKIAVAAHSPNAAAVARMY